MLKLSGQTHTGWVTQSHGLFRIRIQVTSTCGATLKSFALGFCPKYFLGVTLHVGSQEKNWGKKSMTKIFRVHQGKKNQKREKNINLQKPSHTKGLWKQDQVNTADFAFIFLIILFISQNKWSGWSGRRRWFCLVWSLQERYLEGF